MILLAIPVVIMGFVFFHDDLNGFFGNSIFILPSHPVMSILTASYPNAGYFLVHKFLDLPCLLAFSGILITYLAYVQFPRVPAFIADRFFWLKYFLVKKYFIDDIYDTLSTGATRLIGMICYRVGDIFVIDRGLVEGSARGSMFVGAVLRRLQTGKVYHYTLGMVLGVFVLLGLVWFGV